MLEMCAQTDSQRALRRRRALGVTLIELLVVLGILVILSAAIVPTVTQRNPDTIVRGMAQDTAGMMNLIRTRAMSSGFWYRWRINIANNTWQLDRSISTVAFPTVAATWGNEYGTVGQTIPIEQPARGTIGGVGGASRVISDPRFKGWRTCAWTTTIVCASTGMTNGGTVTIFFSPSGKMSITGGSQATITTANRQFTLYFYDASAPDAASTAARKWRTVVYGFAGLIDACNSWDGVCAGSNS